MRSIWEFVWMMVDHCRASLYEDDWHVRDDEWWSWKPAKASYIQISRTTDKTTIGKVQSQENIVNSRQRRSLSFPWRMIIA